jgi:DNA transposition AAA+ family ATPase
MSQTAQPVKGSVAHLNNVALAAVCMQRLLEASSHLPRIGVLYGKSGLGKSFAACYLVNRYNAYRIECKSVWNRKTVLEEILQRMGIMPGKTMPVMLNQVCAQLQISGRPLIIDEMDHLVDKSAVEVVRDIFDGSQAPILLIGEENIPGKLERWERVHSRVLDWTAAQKLDLEDAQTLADFYCRGIAVEPDLLAQIHRMSDGSARRICVNLELIEEIARRSGLTSINLDALKTSGQTLYTGRSPVKGGSK